MNQKFNASKLLVGTAGFQYPDWKGIVYPADVKKKYGHELKTSLIDPPIAKWLVNEYGAAELATNNSTASRAQKHALVVRACHCGRKIAGNAYFRHVRGCQSAAAPSVGHKPNQVLSPGAGCTGMSG